MLVSPSSLALVASLVLAAIFFLYHLARPKPIPGIPYDRESARNIFGDVPAALKHHAETSEMMAFLLARCEQLKSPIIQMFMRPFGRPWVVMVDSRESQDILYRRTREFDRSEFAIGLFIATFPYNQVSMHTNDQWRSNRRLVSETMSPQFLNSVAAPQVHESTLDLINLWGQKLRLAKGHAIEVMQDIQMCTVDTIWATAFGTKIDACKSQSVFLASLDEIDLPKHKSASVTIPVGEVPRSYWALTAIAKSSEIPLNSPFGRHHHRFAVRFYPSLRRAVALKNKMVKDGHQASWRKFASGHPANKGDVKSAVDLVVEREISLAKKEGRAPEHDSKFALDELSGFLVAGFETIFSTISWGLKYLGAYPDVQRKLRSTLRSTFKGAFEAGAQPEPEGLAKYSIPYLDAFIDEVLRHSCIAPSNSRVATVDTNVLGYHIPKGTDVVMLTVGPGYKSPAMSIDEHKRSKSCRENRQGTERWEQFRLEDFVPERWLVQNDKGEIEYDSRAAPMQAFGGGLRGCFGKRLAYVEMRIIYSLIIWNFELQPTPPAITSFKAVDIMAHQPQHTYIVLSEAPQV